MSIDFKLHRTPLVDLPELLPERRQRLRDPKTSSEHPQSKK